MSSSPSSVTRTVLLDGIPVALHMRSYGLEVVKGPDLGRSGRFDRRVVVVGTSPESDLVLDDPTVSRAHCRIEADEAGYRVTDLRSKNGTFLGRSRVREAYLDPDVALRLGETTLRWTPGDEEVEVRFSTEGRFGALFGEGLRMREIFATLERVAPTDATVLIEGESGTGKELAARAVHDHSKRAKGPFVVFDCSAVPKDLIESELFGHLRGAFTGATADRPGAFVSAKGGTLFLDELGELALELQPKLLRAIESRQVKPVGASREVDTDVRLVAATNRKLAREVEAGNFREDLYYRLAVIMVRLPPLREQPEEIPLLVRHFIRDLGHHPDHLKVSYDTMARLQVHRWQGNVRELRNFVERAALLSGGERLSDEFLDAPAPSSRPAEATPDGLAVDLSLPFKDAKARLVETFETTYWQRLLESTRGNISEAARRAGIHRKSAEYLVKKLDLR